MAASRGPTGWRQRGPRNLPGLLPCRAAPDTSARLHVSMEMPWAFPGPAPLGSRHVREKETTMKGLIGKKVGMTQVFGDDGNVVPVTVIDTNTCEVVGKRTLEKDKYSARGPRLQGREGEAPHQGAGRLTSRRPAPRRKRMVKEFRVTADEAAKYTVGEAVKPDMFKKGQLVDVTGITKGRGYPGRDEAVELPRLRPDPRHPRVPPAPRRHRSAQDARPRVPEQEAARATTASSRSPPRTSRSSR